MLNQAAEAAYSVQASDWSDGRCKGKEGVSGHGQLVTAPQIIRDGEKPDIQFFKGKKPVYNIKISFNSKKAQVFID